MYATEQHSHRLPTLPPNTHNIIIVLGQCTLPSGQPHPWLIDRVDTAYQLLAKHGLALEDTCFIVSGSDVSNREYGIWDKDKKHPSQAYFMSKLLHQLYHQDTKQQEANKDKDFDFGKRVLVEDQANTTIENFYFAFRIIDKSKASKEIKNIFIVTSDFHLARAKFCFDTLFFRDKTQIFGTEQSLPYQKNIIFVASPSKWQDQAQKKKKWEKEQKLYHASWLIDETRRTASKLWSQLGGTL